MVYVPLCGSGGFKDSAKLYLLIFFNLLEGTVVILLVVRGGEINSLERRIEKHPIFPGTSKLSELSAAVKLFWPSRKLELCGRNK